MDQCGEADTFKYGFCDKLVGSQSANQDSDSVVYLPFIGWMLAVISTLFSIISTWLAFVQKQQTSRTDGYEKLKDMEFD